jgi:hypothetical protein
VSDILKEFSERHETDREPFPTWRSRKIDELDDESVWIVEMSRATFGSGGWIQAENIFHYSEVAAREKKKYWENNSGACWEFRVARFKRNLAVAGAEKDNP